MVEPKKGQPYTVILVASSRQEKSAWTSDISQVSFSSRCIKINQTGGAGLNKEREKFAYSWACLISIIKTLCLWRFESQTQGCNQENKVHHKSRTLLHRWSRGSKETCSISFCISVRPTSSY